MREFPDESELRSDLEDIAAANPAPLAFTELEEAQEAGWDGGLPESDSAVAAEDEAARKAKESSLWTQLIRFIISGCISAVVDYGLLLLLSHLGLDPTLAKAISFICGTTTAYMINRRWTFRAEPSTKRLIAVIILYAITFGLNVGIFHVVYTATLTLGHFWAKTIGFVVGQGVATAVNFVVQRGFIFKVR